jgi:hypothetical protein
MIGEGPKWHLCVNEPTGGVGNKVALGVRNNVAPGVGNKVALKLSKVGN